MTGTAPYATVQLVGTDHQASVALQKAAKLRILELKFRPPGAPAGTWPHTPWWQCVFHDPYERVNFWSHFVPGVVFLLLGVAGLSNLIEGGGAMGVFGACAACTHLFSALTHVFPDSHSLTPLLKQEKLDHLGIVACIIGTPVSALLALEHGHLLPTLQVLMAVMLVAAFLPPLPRTLGFAAGTLTIFGLHAAQLAKPSIVIQLVLYGLGGFSFIRNSGHQRWPGLADHHFLHYLVTAACTLHAWFIWSEMKVYKQGVVA